MSEEHVQVQRLEEELQLMRYEFETKVLGQMKDEMFEQKDRIHAYTRAVEAVWRQKLERVRDAASIAVRDELLKASREWEKAIESYMDQQQRSIHEPTGGSLEGYRRAYSLLTKKDKFSMSEDSMEKNPWEKLIVAHRDSQLAEIHKLRSDLEENLKNSAQSLRDAKAWQLKFDKQLETTSKLKGQLDAANKQLESLQETYDEQILLEEKFTQRIEELKSELKNQLEMFEAREQSKAVMKVDAETMTQPEENHDQDELLRVRVSELKEQSKCSEDSDEQARNVSQQISDALHLQEERFLREMDMSRVRLMESEGEVERLRQEVEKHLAQKIEARRAFAPFLQSLLARHRTHTLLRAAAAKTIRQVLEHGRQATEEARALKPSSQCQDSSEQNEYEEGVADMLAILSAMQQQLMEQAKRSPAVLEAMIGASHTLAAIIIHQSDEANVTEKVLELLIRLRGVEDGCYGTAFKAACEDVIIPGSHETLGGTSEKGTAAIQCIGKDDGEKIGRLAMLIWGKSRDKVCVY